MNTGFVKWAALIAILAKLLSMIAGYTVIKVGIAAMENAMWPTLMKLLGFTNLIKDLSLLIFFIAFLIFISSLEKERKNNA